MILAAIAAILPAQAAEPVLPITALVSNMFRKYSGASVIQAVVKTTASDGAGTVTVDTTLQFERPSKVYLQQVEKSGRRSNTYFIVSDGKNFMYPSPGQSLPDPSRYLTDPVLALDGVTYDVGAIVATGSMGIAERSPVIDIFTGRNVDMADVRATWASIRDGGAVQFGGKPARRATGSWRRNGNAPATGTFEIFLSEDADLLGYRIVEYLGRVRGRDARLTITYTVDARVNGTADQSLFSLSRIRS